MDSDEAQPADLLHAIHGMPPRTLLLPSVNAGQSQISTDRSIPLLSPDVPSFMPQTCPSRLWVMSRFRAVVSSTLPAPMLGADQRVRRSPTERCPGPCQVLPRSPVSNLVSKSGW